MSDCVKRQDAIDTFLVGKNTFAGFCTIEQAIENIESVESADVVEAQYGEWVDYYGNDKCTACGWECGDIYYLGDANYCPNCGSDMRGEKNG